MNRVFDCTMFFNELDMLELRLNTLRDVVDYFVVVEAGQTHSGQPKPYVFSEALKAGRFAEFADKIVYHRVPTLEGANSWEREHYNRAQIGDVLERCAAPDDFVIVADCDEIPRPESVQYVVEARKHAAWEAATLELDLYYYDFQHRVHQGWGIGMSLWREQHDANKIRRSEFNTPSVITVPNAGWHLSYFLRPEGVVEKLDAFMHHADVAANVPRDPVWIAERMKAGQDLFGRTVEIERVQPDNLPPYVQAHADHYRALGWLE